MEVRQPCIVDIPWEDVLFPRVFSFLNYDDLLNLQAAIADCSDAVNAYFAQIKTVDMSIETPEALQAICERTTCVRDLDLSHCKYVRDATMRLVIKNNPHLTILNVCNCPNLTSSGVQPIVNAKKLISISVRRNPWVTNNFVDLMSIHVTQLEEVDLGMCRVDNGSLKLFFYSCKRMRKIDLEDNCYINDATVYIIGMNCPMLESLNISGSKTVGEISVRFVIRVCPRLHSLRLRGCDKVSTAFIKGYQFFYQCCCRSMRCNEPSQANSSTYDKDAHLSILQKVVDVMKTMNGEGITRAHVSVKSQCSMLLLHFAEI